MNMLITGSKHFSEPNRPTTTLINSGIKTNSPRKYTTFISKGNSHQTQYS